MLFLRPCLTNAVCANSFLLPSCSNSYEWCLMGAEVSLFVFSRRKRTQTEGSPVCAVETSAPASVSMAGGTNPRTLKHGRCCLLPWQEMFFSKCIFTFYSLTVAPAAFWISCAASDNNQQLHRLKSTFFLRLSEFRVIIMLLFFYQPLKLKHLNTKKANNNSLFIEHS